MHADRTVGHRPQGGALSPRGRKFRKRLAPVAPLPKHSLQGRAGADGDARGSRDGVRRTPLSQSQEKGITAVPDARGTAAVGSCRLVEGAAHLVAVVLPDAPELPRPLVHVHPLERSPLRGRRERERRGLSGSEVSWGEGRRVASGDRAGPSAGPRARLLPRLLAPADRVLPTRGGRSC